MNEYSSYNVDGGDHIFPDMNQFDSPEKRLNTLDNG